MDQAISGFIISLLTQGAKKVNGIPVSEGQKFKLRALVAVLSLVGTIITAYLHGALADASTIQIVSNTIMNWAWATISYNSVIR